MILRNCRVIPELCEGFHEERVDIRIGGKLISDILPAGGKYTGEETIDCSGKTVLPGLFNLHTHLMFNYDNITRDPSPEMCMLVAIRHMNTLLSYGYTSIRDCGSPYGVIFKLRDEINKGNIIGPDIKASGCILSPEQAYTPEHLKTFTTAGDGSPVSGPYSARAIARREIARGADFLKVLNGCATGIYSKRGTNSLFFKDELDEIKKVADAENTYVAMHCISEESNMDAIELGVRTIEHAFFLTRSNVDRLEHYGNRTCIVPTLAVYYTAAGEGAAMESSRGIRMAYDAGTLLGWGTDIREDRLSFGLEVEFVARQKCWGLTPMELLKQATINSAIINGTDSLRGSIKVGKRADFAIVEGEPDKDLSLFSKPCSMVFKDGALISKEGMIQRTEQAQSL